MRNTSSSRRLRATVALSITALVVLGVYLAAPDDSDRRPLVVNLVDAVAWFMGGVVLLVMREGKVAGSARMVGFTLLIGSAVIGVVFVSGLGSAVEPGVADMLFLLPLLPLVIGFRSEIRRHVPIGDRRELATDAALIVSAFMAGAYVLIRPVDASAGVSASAVTFSLLTAFLLATYPALAIWVPPGRTSRAPRCSRSSAGRSSRSDGSGRTGCTTRPTPPSSCRSRSHPSPSWRPTW
jgi:hypothetical protein